MTNSAWVLIVIVWTFIISLTLYYFIKVLKSTPKK
jgi:hypothetical protein